MVGLAPRLRVQLMVSIARPQQHLYLAFGHRVMSGFLDPTNNNNKKCHVNWNEFTRNGTNESKWHTAEDTDALVVASASPFSFESWWCERPFVSVLSSDSRGERGVWSGVPGMCFCSWLNCVCTCVACFCNSAAAAAASLCFFNSDWWWRSCARISFSNKRASRTSRSLCAKCISI